MHLNNCSITQNISMIFICQLFNDYSLNILFDNSIDPMREYNAAMDDKRLIYLSKLLYGKSKFQPNGVVLSPFRCRFIRGFLYKKLRFGWPQWLMPPCPSHCGNSSSFLRQKHLIAILFETG